MGAKNVPEGKEQRVNSLKSKIEQLNADLEKANQEVEAATTVLQEAQKDFAAFSGTISSWDADVRARLVLPKEVAGLPGWEPTSQQLSTLLEQLLNLLGEAEKEVAAKEEPKPPGAPAQPPAGAGGHKDGEAMDVGSDELDLEELASKCEGNKLMQLPKDPADKRKYLEELCAVMGKRPRKG